MPSATAPISPKSSGFTKPAGFNRPQSKKVEEEDDEPKKDHPVVIGLAVLALLFMAFVCYMQYSIDQLPNRQSDDMRVFGAPGTAESDDSGSAASESDDDDEDSGDSGSAASEDSDSDDDSDDEDE